MSWYMYLKRFYQPIQRLLEILPDWRPPQQYVDAPLFLRLLPDVRNIVVYMYTRDTGKKEVGGVSLRSIRPECI